MKTSLWAPIPCKAIPIQITFAANDDLDLLERTILRLVRIKAASVPEVAEILGFAELSGSSSDSKLARRAGEEMIDSAIRGLVDKGLLEFSDEDQDRFRAEPSAEDVRSELHEGWAVYVSHSHSLLPTIIKGRNFPSKISPDDGIERTAESPKISVPSPDETSKMLMSLGSRSPQCWIPKREKKDPSTDSTSFELGPRVRAIFHDRRKSARSGVCWAKVELLPALSGPADVVLFEPSLSPAILPIEGVPFSPRLRRWLEAEDPQLWNQLQELGKKAAEELSAVLRMLRIDPETIDREVSEHRTLLSQALALPASLAIAGIEDLEEELRLAHKWLVLEKRDPSLITQVRDCYSRSVELMCDILAGIAEKWISEWRIQHHFATLSTDKLHTLQREFEDNLDSRLKHVSCSALPWSFKTRIKSAFKDTGGLPGAGKNVGRWLLPLALLDEVKSKAYGIPIAHLISSNLNLFGMLNDLIRFRNAIAHADKTQIPKHLCNTTQLDRAALMVAGALAKSYPDGDQFRLKLPVTERTSKPLAPRS